MKTALSNAAVIPEGLQALEQEILTYAQELPRLLQEGEAGRFVLIKGAKIHGIWDTYQDASQNAQEKLGLDRPFLIHRLDARDQDRLPLRQSSPGA